MQECSVDVEGQDACWNGSAMVSGEQELHDCFVNLIWTCDLQEMEVVNQQKALQLIVVQQLAGVEMTRHFALLMWQANMRASVHAEVRGTTRCRRLQ